MTSPLDGPPDRCLCLRETTVEGSPVGPVIPHPYCRAKVHDCAAYDARNVGVGRAYNDRRVEVAARAYYEWATMNPDDESRWEDEGPHQGFARSRVEVILAAADAVDPLRAPGSIEIPIDLDPMRMAEALRGAVEKVDALRALVDEILGTFTRKGSIGSIDSHVRSDWQATERVEVWRRRAHRP